ncbi:radical SAM family heme chaperone HemW [Tenacibaculum finnmarkense]|uniref:radical SAM family heme chaperone HemW n=1 Tax=Tenacibaculum finnmarkense TaxID=2781243 RepID=UPI001EFBB463|nr:radical SAM family heme chaperone HemW [Tenacibaculum finnmarkense]MCG8206061.1 radical SAM family heme chaperone HemW [Tenacibaculum finnmarkense genomovar finnmarkense]MCG8722170.1 radical SAM family heme chaperone HemW [Tenacibaculum finnmarkense]MCG8740494.1 radical SAM family heme chaperone HemW [Tenacibaculum finnmarkense]MCG8763777.1 radical SAM family heme chaperone HemW [Tenacibaculum finnmarkense]MCG8776641.1 radical SAM family heme chaperone HemW [Tenacibaculum finnmarkense]
MAGIYIHIPFCKQACFYCDFHFSTSLKKKNELISCLITELEIRKNELQNELIETIYFGGGTPSLLSSEEITSLLNAIYQHYRVIENPEITLEANPDDLSEEKILELANSPINRLSIGVQSFFEEDLKSMNRAHNSKEAKECLSIATRYFDNITVDLIYGVPNMSNERWKENLQIAFDFGVNHISSYALTVEPKTVLDSFVKNGKYPEPDETEAKEHFDILVAETAKNGFVHYEISNFGKPAYFSKHNTSYWLGKKYIGIGPSAHSFSKTHRSWNVANNTKYIKELQEGKLPNEQEELSEEDQFNEYLMTGLRTIWGVSLAEIQANFKACFKDDLLKSSQKFISEGLLIIEKNTLKTTPKGKFLADGLASELFRIK